METKTQHRVVIVGGGFGGIATALRLRQSRCDITLISNIPHFEYHAALYRVVTGRSPLEVCIPLSEIFPDKRVRLIEATIVKVDPTQKVVTDQDGSQYHYDSLVLGLGSETSYFDVPGLSELAFGLKSITDALRLKRHLHQLFSDAAAKFASGEKTSIQLVIVGAGSTGVELAGELAIYSKKIAAAHKLPPTAITIDLFEAADRILPNLPVKVSTIVFNRLHRLGVNIFLNTPIIKEDITSVYLKDMQMKTKTVIWSAGVKTNSFYRSVKGLSFDEKGRVEVDNWLRTKKVKDIYIVGDAAATAHSGFAQTAWANGVNVAETIMATNSNRSPRPSRPPVPVSAIPVGDHWAVVAGRGFLVTGRIGWIIRRLIDRRFFGWILPPAKARQVFADGQTLCETCPICGTNDIS